MKFKFRLVFFHSEPGFFRIDKKSIGYNIASDISITIEPRDANTLIEAKQYHIESSGFNSEEEARKCGEKIRNHLRLLNCHFHLGLTIPFTDGFASKANAALKEEHRKNGVELIDTIIGLLVYPDEQKYVEFAVFSELDIFREDPYYLLKSIKEIWSNNYKFDDCTNEILEILNISVREKSPKLKFLTAYLAMEQIIKREMRTEYAQELIKDFIKMTNASEISNNEKKSLTNALSQLKRESFRSAFISFARRITFPTTILNMPVVKFAKECVKIRNKIAHNVSTDKLPELENYAKNLIKMSLGIIWSENNLPELSLYLPGHKLELKKLEFKFL